MYRYVHFEKLLFLSSDGLRKLVSTNYEPLLKVIVINRQALGLRSVVGVRASQNWALQCRKSKSRPCRVDENPAEVVLRVLLVCASLNKSTAGTLGSALGQCDQIGRFFLLLGYLESQN